jgi:hypothetical protein
MQRGVQVTSDNAHVAVFAQLTGTSDTISLTDAVGGTTTLRSRGSWDLIAIKLDATDGSGVWAIDGGGDDMEYFHGFGMDGHDNILISGYSRSSSFHFGDHAMVNPQSRLRDAFVRAVVRGGHARRPGGHVLHRPPLLRRRRVLDVWRAWLLPVRRVNEPAGVDWPRSGRPLPH